MVCSIRKGKVAERNAAHYLSELFGIKVIRGVQYCGLTGSADIVGLEGLHVEVKAVESLNIDKAMLQSISDAKPYEVPIVFHKKNNKPWRITLNADDLLRFLDVCNALVDKGHELSGDLGLKNDNSCQDIG